jgi:xyloglucan-specific exo-beta-1,4-glucanase
VGFGKAAPGAAYPAIYVYGTLGGELGVWQSVDEARTWTRIDDAKHRFGALANGGFVRGDANTFGVVYRSTAGRGIAARIPAGWTGVRRARGPVRNWSVTGPTLRLEVPPGPALLAEVRELRGRLVAARWVGPGAPADMADWVPRSGTYLFRLGRPGAGGFQAFKAAVLK